VLPTITIARYCSIKRLTLNYLSLLIIAHCFNSIGITKFSL
jgi:hypothetical protein